MPNRLLSKLDLILLRLYNIDMIRLDGDHMSYSILDIQVKLKQLGYDPGPIDGELGPLTSKAIRSYKKAQGLPDTDIIGPLTIASLFDLTAPSIPAIKSNKAKEPIWMQVAKNYLGIEEISGYKNNPIILGWWKRLGLPFDDDETPWCAGFVGGCLEECGIKSTRSGLALSYSNFGIRLSGPCIGAIATMKRTGGGHVAFVAGKDKRGNLMLLGGNQSNAVNIKPFDVSRITAYTWPMGVPRPDNVGIKYLPIIKSDGIVSTNEA